MLGEAEKTGAILDSYSGLSERQGAAAFVIQRSFRRFIVRMPALPHARHWNASCLARERVNGGGYSCTGQHTKTLLVRVWGRYALAFLCTLNPKP